MSKCAPEQRVTYISGLFLDGALSWWNLQVQTLGETAAYALSWDELKELMRKKYCSRAEIQKLETEFWNLKMDGPKVVEYIQRFHDLSRVVPYLVEPEFKRIERFIWGLASQILSMVTASKPPTIAEAIDLSVTLTEEALRMGKFSKSETNKKETQVESSGDNKRKFSNLKKGTQVIHDHSNANKRREANPPCGMKAYGATNKASGKVYLGSKPRCDECKFHHEGRCLRPKCDRCGKEGHSKDVCWARYPNQGGYDNYNLGGNDNGRVPGCFNCGDVGHFRKDCPKKNQARRSLRDRSS
ncbi:putative transcription factor interactor and regulator CCHC(Zn) family [Helianthus annuus]|nr:putative transcription factor interactor and regulator CCHC(Zn) family [Helianthus annuus]